MIAGDFLPPRALDRTIPAPLEAICLKAMAKKPEARYGSVRALAQDLEHWLADEPTAAYPESGVEKMTRWFRQHRAWTFAAGAALVCISMVAVVAALFIEGARHREEVCASGSRDQFRHGPEGRRRLFDERQREHAAAGARLGRHPKPAPRLAQECPGLLRAVRRTTER